MLGKRGLSPLISTILLIALAVALGAMIMNWSSGVATATDTNCADISLEVQEAFGQKLLCYSEEEGRLRVVIKNTGIGPISAILYRRITEDYRTIDLEIPNSFMSAGKVIDTRIGFQPTDKIHIEMIPQIQSNGELILCTEKSIIREEILPCS